MADRPLLAVLAGFAFVGVILGVGVLTQPRVPANAFEPTDERCFTSMIRAERVTPEDLREELDPLPTYLPEDFRLLTAWKGPGESGPGAIWTAPDCRQATLHLYETQTNDRYPKWTLFVDAPDQCSAGPLRDVRCVDWRLSTDVGELSVTSIGLTVEETERIARSIRF